MTEEEGHLQLPRADAIRSRLIDTFSLIEHLQGLSQAVPRHTVREILDPSRQKKLMSGDQHQLVRFSIKPRHMGITHSQRMLSRLHVRCSQRPPLSLWAGWVLESPIFSNFIISLIFLNTIVLMVETELMESTNTKLWPLKLTLGVADWFILLSFILEIVLMWMSSFLLFWKSAWNVFDFTVTTLSVLPEFVMLMGVSGNSVWLQLLRVSRVLRSLKLFARFRQIRVIILALVRALKSMTFLLMLLLIFFYIFAVTGVYFFEDYSRSTIEDLQYNMFFSDLLNSLVTVFILFTLDHWYAVLQDVWKVPEASRVFSSIYVILWLLLGSIIFRNIIVAMMEKSVKKSPPNNYQKLLENLSSLIPRKAILRKVRLRKAMRREVTLRKKIPTKVTLRKVTPRKVIPTKVILIKVIPIKVILRRMKLKNRRKTHQKEKSSPLPLPPLLYLPSAPLQLIINTLKLDWETLVHENLPGLMDMDQDDRVVWPRDSLFRYFELLEKLQYNLEERKKLQEFAVQALMNFEDK
ncbi:cation channel sperm-associated protein 2 isoform X2 [Meriones unguiculatus]|uniref:cation channel sperm-associated protein 2 isoform X2 n=1 Tax=Meriones unguiculatus TaxID=10047 RepID=UPI00293ED8E5|nr:cation channel sperm-associated protein 2 isoform X2 [Meriones unguiculatus]